MKNGQSRETGNIVYTRHRTKTNKIKNTTQKAKKISNKDPTKIPGVNPGTREGKAVPASYKTFAMLLVSSIYVYMSVCSHFYIHTSPNTK